MLLCKHLDAVTCLQLCSCQALNDDMLRRIALLPNIHTLDMGKCTHVTDEGVSALSASSNLEVLQMYDCDGISDRSLQSLSCLTKLVSLDVSGCKISDEGVTCMQLPMLRMVNLLRCSGPLTDSSIVRIGEHCTALTTLRVSLSYVVCLVRLCAFKEFPYCKVT